MRIVNTATMLGALITLAFCFGIAGWGQVVFGRWLAAVYPLARPALGALFGLASLGTLTLFVGLIPGGLHWGVYPVVAVGALGLIPLWRNRSELWPVRPSEWEWAFVAAFLVSLLFGLVSVLAPSDLGDWDTLSHHLASVKIWLEAGQIEPIPFMHQSNFPFAVDNLFLWGHVWGGQSGAKMFSLVFFALGWRTVFALSRQAYGRNAAWWSALLYASVPVLLWESGTAYVDVVHGLFAGLGIWFASRAAFSDDRRFLLLCALSLGFAAGTKYTGLQTLAVVGLVLAVAWAFSRRKGWLRDVATIAGISILIAGPWYVKNWAWTGNPVYPFFHSVFQGRNWDDRRSAIYTNEQRTFGVGRAQASGQPKANLDFAQIGHAVFGLTYQPGRYVNPAQTQGGGEPLGAIGVPVVVALLLLLMRGRSASRAQDAVALGAVVLSLAIWFVLSQQSRYLTSIVPPLAILAGGLFTWRGIGTAVKVLIAAQAAMTLFLMKSRRFDTQVQVAVGRESRDEYQTRTIPFFAAAQRINEVARGGKVALYDEVFGYLLDVPYLWANPGHSLLIPYDELETGTALADELRKQGITHVYISGLAKMGELLAEPISPEKHAQIMGNWEIRWKLLLADAYATGRLALVEQFRGGTLFELR